MLLNSQNSILSDVHNCSGAEDWGTWGLKEEHASPTAQLTLLRPNCARGESRQGQVFVWAVEPQFPLCFYACAALSCCCARQCVPLVLKPPTSWFFYEVGPRGSRPHRYGQLSSRAVV
ncbi:unnamed protein product [Prorocentrum cordatum]|uniref:Uncharacterized protein n=1 Tax=Prorocentrum cordatum TaxID=2364126 RepID=A0ABN9T1L5_9DINO|nr:unnamed protein product [Polarella glacialis]